MSPAIAKGAYYQTLTVFFHAGVNWRVSVPTGVFPAFPLVDISSSSYYGAMVIPMDNLDSDASDCSIASRYSLRLLNQSGMSNSPREVTAGIHPAKNWAESGLMTLTGRTPTLCPVPLASCADGALNAFRGERAWARSQ